MSQTSMLFRERTPYSSHHCHQRLLTKRLLRSLPSKVLKVYKEKNSRISHNPFNTYPPSTWLFFLLYSFFPYCNYSLLSLQSGFRLQPAAASAFPALRWAKLVPLACSPARHSSPWIPSFLLRSLTSFWSSLHNRRRSSRRNLNSTKQMGNDTNVFWGWQSAYVVNSNYGQYITML